MKNGQFGFVDSQGFRSAVLEVDRDAPGFRLESGDGTFSKLVMNNCLADYIHRNTYFGFWFRHHYLRRTISPEDPVERRKLAMDSRLRAGLLEDGECHRPEAIFENRLEQYFAEEFSHEFRAKAESTASESAEDKGVMPGGECDPIDGPDFRQHDFAPFPGEATIRCTVLMIFPVFFVKVQGCAGDNGCFVGLIHQSETIS